MDYVMEDYYVETDYISELDNGQVMSNIRKLNEPEEESEILRIMKFNTLVNINKTEGEDSLQSDQKKKQNIVNQLYMAREKLDSLITLLNLTTLEKPMFKLKSRLSHSENKMQTQETTKINYLKKVDSFEKSICNFKNSLMSITERNLSTHSIFKELLYLKELGFLLEEHFTLPEFKGENAVIKLDHKLIKIYENLKTNQSQLSSKFLFELNYKKKENKYELANDFYEKFIKKYKLYFSLEIKTAEYSLTLNEENFENILNEIISGNLKTLIKNELKYKLETFLLFYVKYFVYILFKFEIRTLTKILDDNLFYYKNFNFMIREDVKEYSIKLNSFDFLEINLKIGKRKLKFKDNFQDAEMFDSNNIMNYTFKSKQESNPTMKRSFNFLIRLLIKNILYDMKIYKLINELHLINTKKYSTNYDILDNSIFINNLAKISQILIRKNFVNLIQNKLQMSKTLYSNVQNYININQKEFTYKFVVYNNTILTQLYNPKLEMYLTFCKIGTSIETKYPNKNSIYVFEKGTSYENLHKIVDFNYLNLYFNNVLDSFEKINS